MSAAYRTGGRKLRSFILVSLSGFATFAGVNIHNGNEKFYEQFVMPVIHNLDPERAHRWAVLAGKYRLFPKSRVPDNELLRVNVFGINFPNPVGIAAGFDKHAEAVVGLKDIGFGFVEIGSVTPNPQDGNEKPRVFRLLQDQAVINRYGFNSEGHDVVYSRLEKLRKDNFDGVIGVNLGKNKTSQDAIKDYVDGIKKFGPVADYLVINVSSPNTPGLRSLQNKQILTDLLKALIEARNRLPREHQPPLLLKLAPDLTAEERKDIASVLKKKECRVDGLIISNTTIERPLYLKSDSLKNETGGLSGAPLKDVATQMVADMYKLTDKMTIIGVGGISSGKDAYEKIKAGASMVQLYTSLVYQGPPIVDKVKNELTELLKRDGYTNVSEAVGKSVK